MFDWLRRKVPVGGGVLFRGTLPHDWTNSPILPSKVSRSFQTRANAREASTGGQSCAIPYGEKRSVWRCERTWLPRVPCSITTPA